MNNVVLTFREYQNMIKFSSKIEILNSTFRQFSGIYLCISGVYSFTYQCYTLHALLTAVERGSP